MSYLILIQLIGLLGAACTLVAFLMKSRIGFRYIWSIGSLLFAIHFLALGYPIAAFIKLYTAGRTFVSSHEAHKKTRGALFLLGYIGIFFLVSPETLIDLFPIFSGIIGTVALFYFREVWTRIILLLATGLWLWHNISIASWGGIALEASILVANVVTIFRMKRVYEISE